MATKRVFQSTIDGKISHDHVDAWVDYSVETLDENIQSLIVSLDRNSKSSGFLARVGI